MERQKDRGVLCYGKLYCPDFLKEGLPRDMVVQFYAWKAYNLVYIRL